MCRVPSTLFFLALCPTLFVFSGCSKTTLVVENKTPGEIRVQIQDVAKKQVTKKGKTRAAAPIVHTIAANSSKDIKLSVPALNDKASVPVEITGDWVRLSEDVEVIVGEANPKMVEATGGAIDFTNRLDKDIPHLHFKRVTSAAGQFLKVGAGSDWGENYGPIKVGETKRIGGLEPAIDWHLKRAAGLAPVLGPIAVELGSATTVELTQEGMKTSKRGKDVMDNVAAAVKTGADKTFGGIDKAAKHTSAAVNKVARGKGKKGKGKKGKRNK